MKKSLLRQYFFYIDFKGLLHFQQQPHLHRRQHFSIATAIKDQRFLSQFYKNLKQIPPKYPNYPFLSECWGEHNYVRCDISPVVFSYLTEGQLIYSCRQVFPFKPESLRVDSQGYIYHEWREGIDGVFGSDLVGQLSESLSLEGGQAEIKYDGKSYRIPKKKMK